MNSPAQKLEKWLVIRPKQISLTILTMERTQSHAVSRWRHYFCLHLHFSGPRWLLDTYDVVKIADDSRFFHFERYFQFYSKYMCSSVLISFKCWKMNSPARKLEKWVFIRPKRITLPILTMIGTQHHMVYQWRHCDVIMTS